METNQSQSKYSRLNTRMEQYVHAMNTRASPETLHYQLRDLIAEAIRVDITLARLLAALAESRILEGNTEAFIRNVSKHYGRAESAGAEKLAEEEEQVLHGLMRRHFEAIADDPVLADNFKRLLACIGTMDPTALVRCENILAHLIAETGGTVTDDQRMENESPAWVKENSEARKHIQDILELKDALEQYHAQYMKSRSGRGEQSQPSATIS